MSENSQQTDNLLPHHSRSAFLLENENINSKWKVPDEVRECRDRLRRALRYNFLSYGDRWKVNHKPQGKLIYQFIKAIFVIIQLYCISSDVTKPNNDLENVNVM